MPLVFTELLCLSLFLLATEQKYYTHEEESDHGLDLHPSAVTADGSMHMETIIIHRQHSEVLVFVVIPTAQLSLIKSNIPIHVFAAINIPHIKCLKTFVLCITTFWLLFILDFADCSFLWRELTQSQGPISQKHLSECIHRHILYPSSTLGAHKFSWVVGTCKHNTSFIRFLTQMWIAKLDILGFAVFCKLSSVYPSTQTFMVGILRCINILYWIWPLC